ncbi:hypothetical protein ACHAXN_001720, partial [Cyclotella atomus]
MGEERKIPKVEEKGKRPFYPRNNNVTKKDAFKAPTSGLESMIFKQGTAKDAAQFVETKKALAKHVGATFKYGNNMAQRAIDRLEAPTLDEPTDPMVQSNPPTAAELKDFKRWELEYDDYRRDVRAWKDAGPRAFQLVLQHVHPDLEEKLESDSGWKQLEEDQDAVKLLILIRNYVHNHDEVKQGTMSLVQQDLNWHLGYQKERQLLTDFHKEYKARLEVVRALGGFPGYHPVLYNDAKESMALDLGIDVRNLTEEQKAECQKTAAEEYIACHFIALSNDKVYGPVKRRLDNMFLMGSETYPKALDEAYRYLHNYKPEIDTGRRGGRPAEHLEDGVSFAERNERQVGPCDGCGKMGHLVRQCNTISDDKKAELVAKRGGKVQQGQNHSEVGKPEQVEEGVSNINIINAELQECLEAVAHMNVDAEEASVETMDGAPDEDVFDGLCFQQPSMFVQDSVSLLSPGREKRGFDCGENKLFLDTCATQHTMFTKKFLTNIQQSNVYLRQNCNAGSKLTNKVGYWGDLKFYLSEGGIANLLSVPALEADGWTIEVKTGEPTKALSPDGVLLTFKRDLGVTKGMPYIDMTQPKDHVSRIYAKDSTAFVETVRKNMEGFTIEEVQRAVAARDALAMMAGPPEDKVIKLVSQPNIANMPFNSSDFANSKAVFGPDRPAIRSKTTRKPSSKVRPRVVKIPMQLYERLKEVILTADVMFVNGLPFFITLSRGIKLITTEFTPSRTADKLYKALLKVCRFYRRHGFLVVTTLMDMEFKKVDDISDECVINTTAAREHVTDIERCIRFVKDRCRYTIQEVPYKDCMPDSFIIYLVKFVVMWMNAFPSGSGVSTEFSP